MRYFFVQLVYSGCLPEAFCFKHSSLHSEDARYDGAMETQELVLLNRNGKRISMTLRVPHGEPRGTLVLMHGLAGWKDQPTVLTAAHAGVDSGYQVLTFDGVDALRGPDASYWNSTTTGFIHDLEDVLAYTAEQDWYRLPLVLAGHSLGAMCVVRYVRKHPDSASRLLLIAPAVSWKRDRTDKFMHRIRFVTNGVAARKRAEKEGGEKLVMPLYLPWILDYLRYDTFVDAAHVTVPTLVISAEKDLAVAGPEIHAALTKRFKNATQVVIGDADHVFGAHEQELADTIKQWLTSS